MRWRINGKLCTEEKITMLWYYEHDFVSWSEPQPRKLSQITQSHTACTHTSVRRLREHFLLPCDQDLPPADSTDIFVETFFDTSDFKLLRANKWLCKRNTTWTLKEKVCSFLPVSRTGEALCRRFTL
jgi:hypothetical protein